MKEIQEKRQNEVFFISKHQCIYNISQDHYVVGLRKKTK